MAKAMPTKAPTLRTTGFQSAPRPLPKEGVGHSSSALLGLLVFPGCFFGDSMSSSLPKASSQNTSTHGSKLPSRMPAMPQVVRYCHEHPSIPSTLMGATC